MVLKGVADLPLHEGRVPAHLFRRMLELGSVIARYIVEEFGPSELTERLADPFWFQAFNNVIGMDWDSSGSTTVTLYVLKHVFPPEQIRDYELAVIGGKGKDALNTPVEAKKLDGHVDVDVLVRVSRLAAKIDNVALQDGYQLYIHGLLVTLNEKTLIIQQGMMPESRLARRYHILLENPREITCEKDPHKSVASLNIHPALNLVDQASREARRAIVEVVSSTPSESLLSDLARVNKMLKQKGGILRFATGGAITRPFTQTPRGPDSYYRPVTKFETVARAAEILKKEAVKTFDDVLLAKGIGAETVRALALVAHLICGYEPSFRDPTTHPLDPFIYSYAHGGKDGVPYRIRVSEMDKTIQFFSQIVESLKTGQKEKTALARNLSRFVEKLRIRGILPGVWD
mgnify:CR=1 FL=1